MATMATQTATTTPQTMKTLAARRRRAESEIRALDAQRAAREAAAEAQQAEEQAAQAQHTEQHAAQQDALQRMAEYRARLDALTRYEEQPREPSFAEFCAARDREEEAMRQLRALADMEIPHAPMTREEQRELLAELDAAVAASEHEGEGLFYHAGRLWDRSRFY